MLLRQSGKLLKTIFRHISRNRVIFSMYIFLEVLMADKKRSTKMLNPRRNEGVERKKLFEEMLLKEIPGIAK